MTARIEGSGRRRRANLFVHSLITGVALCATARAQAPIVVGAGDDGWVTAPGGAMSDFSGPCPPIPAGFFGPGSPPFAGIITFEGQPLATTPAGALGETDTIIRRTAATMPLDVMGVGPNFMDTVPVEIVALRLRSTVPITIPGFGTWNVEAYLSVTTAQIAASLTISRDCPDGGSFMGTINVTARLVFTPTGGGAAIVLDPAPLKSFSSACSWAIPFGPGGFDPATLLIDPLPAGVGVDGDGNGTFETLTLGDSPNFRAGVIGCGAGAFSLLLCAEATPCEIHEVSPPLDTGGGPPPNDDCLSPINALLGITSFDSTNATDGAGLPLDMLVCDMGPFGDEQIYQDVWFSFTPGATNAYDFEVVDTGSGTWDSRIAVYDQSSCPDDPANVIACDDDDGAGLFSAVFGVPLIGGNTYLVRVGSFSATTSELPAGLSISAVPPPPANDDCPNAATASLGLTSFDSTTATYP